MRKIFKILPLCVLLFAGCTQDYYDNTDKAAVGTVGGAAAGALAGMAFADSGGGKLIGGLIGATIGGFVGNQIGSRLDAKSRRKMEQNTYYALDSGTIGREYTWYGDNSEGYTIPTKEYKRYDDYCREFTQVVKIRGKSETVYGTACKQVDGSWRIVSN